MAVNNPYDKYKQNSVFTATKEELTLMLYEGALKFANQGITAIEEKDYAKANDLIIKVENIIREFQITLNQDVEVSKQLSPLYDYIYNLLVDGNMKKDVAKLSEARDLIREFRNMWKEAMRLARTETGQGGVPASAGGITL